MQIFLAVVPSALSMPATSHHNNTCVFRHKRLDAIVVLMMSNAKILF
jgi:hypothetical protein